MGGNDYPELEEDGSLKIGVKETEEEKVPQRESADEVEESKAESELEKESEKEPEKESESETEKEPEKEKEPEREPEKEPEKEPEPISVLETETEPKAVDEKKSSKEKGDDDNSKEDDDSGKHTLKTKSESDVVPDTVESTGKILFSSLFIHFIYFPFSFFFLKW